MQCLQQRSPVLTLYSQLIISMGLIRYSFSSTCKAPEAGYKKFEGDLCSVQQLLAQSSLMSKKLRTNLLQFVLMW